MIEEPVIPPDGRKKVTIVWKDKDPEEVIVDKVTYKETYVLLDVHSDLQRSISMSAVTEIKVEPAK